MHGQTLPGVVAHHLNALFLPDARGVLGHEAVVGADGGAREKKKAELKSSAEVQQGGWVPLAMIRLLHPSPMYAPSM